MHKKILAIETSCDETSAAVIEDGTKIISNIIATSSTMHEKWGGIVPEVAAREQLKSIIPVIIEALSPYSSSEESSTNREVSKVSSRLHLNNIEYKPIIEKYIDAIAVTVGPGLIGSLLIGVECAKTIAFVTGKPIIPVNHVLAHMYANFLKSTPENSTSGHSPLAISQNHGILKPTANSQQQIAFPAISLVVSGGHTELFLMTSEKDLKWLGGTIDDAAGEAFDKAARLIGFGSRGGLAIQKAACKFKISNLKFEIVLPRPLLHDNTLNFSFSGLKTAILREWNKITSIHEPQTKNPELVNLFAYEVQEAITDVLVKKTLKAAEAYHAKSILISGGVSANLRLREKFIQQLPATSFKLYAPPISLCTDNAAYIGAYAYFRGTPVDWHDICAAPDLDIEI
jgi:N6-L-threonylcarbamoyladenine synthase